MLYRFCGGEDDNENVETLKKQNADTKKSIQFLFWLRFFPERLRQTKEKGKEEDIVRFPKDRVGTPKVTEKKIRKEKDPKVPVRQESRTSQHATLIKRSNAQNDPHVIIGTHQYAPNTKPKSGSKWQKKCVFFSQAKLVTTKNHAVNSCHKNWKMHNN